jgi:type VI secretion system protein ImpA
VERHWEHLHPQLDAADHGDPTARINALMPLLHPGAGLADLRAASLTGRRGSPTVREIELALARAEPDPSESVPTEEALLEGVATALSESPEVGPLMQAGLAAIEGLAATLDARLASVQCVDLAPLKKLLQGVADAGLRAAGRAVPTGGAGLPAVLSVSATVPLAAGAIATRDDAIRALERACEWIERNEPSNPAPLLIRRSQRLMSKNFIDIVRDLMPEGVDQIEKLAGTHQS